MAKIRGIKPEFWTDEDIVELSIAARLLFIGMWNLACDNGHIDDKPKQIKMRVMPADDVNVAELLDELVDNGRIVRGGGTITILRFAEHQRPHKRWWTCCDAPGCARPGDDTTGDDTGPTPPNNRGTPGDQQGDTRGSTADGDGEGDCDVDGELTTTAAAAASRATTNQLPPAVEILRGRLEAHKLIVRWDLATAADLSEIEHLIETHGDAPLVKSALDQYVPDRPARFVSAWLNGWRNLAPPGSLRLVDHNPCPEPGHSGTTRHCPQCASERLAEGVIS